MGKSSSFLFSFIFNYIFSKTDIIYTWIRRKSSASITSYGEAYTAICWYLANTTQDTDLQRVSDHNTSVFYDEPKNPNPNQSPETMYMLSPGTRHIKIDGRNVLVSILRTKDREDKIESISLSTGKKDLAWLKKYVEKCINEYNKSLYEGVPIYACEKYGRWELSNVRPLRYISTIEHPNNAHLEIMELIYDWEKRELEFIERGENYQIGFLLYGKPGTGKTSMAIAIASELKKPLYVMTATPTNIEDMNIYIRLLPKNSVLLIEECDQVFPIRKGEDSKLDRQTANALSYLDGPLSKHGVIRIYVTNHIERLDPAFLRPGRCDYKYEFFETSRSKPVDYKL